MGNTRLEELSRFRHKLGVPAVVGGVIEANREVCFEVNGVRRRGSKEAVAPSDRVHIGSCCKMVTATLFGTFVEGGQADWQMPISDLFPDLARSMDARWQRRTVEELLYCLSGMVANPPRRYLKSAYTDGRPLPEQRTEMATIALSQPPRKPGRFVYSNMSYIVMMDDLRQRIGFVVCNDGRTRVLTQTVSLVHRLLTL